MNAGRDKDAVRDAVDLLLADHLESEALEGLAQGATRLVRTLGKDTIRELVDEIISEIPHTMVRAHALYARASILAPRRGKVSDEDRAQAEKDLDDVARLAKGTVLGVRAGGGQVQEGAPANRHGGAGHRG